jgi:lipopolysaccharide export system protein LptA
VAFDPKRLQKWFAWSAVAVVAVVIGFYGYARLHFNRSIKGLEKKFDVKIEQSAQGFTLTKSEQGRTLFLVHASSVEQYAGGQAALHGVNIVIYDPDGSGADQIYGDDFVYDPNSGDVRADGVVHMELQGASDTPLLAGDIPKELKNPLHLKSSGLTFNQKSGIAKTDHQIEFRAPQATGSAQGAIYDSRTQLMTLQRDVKIRLTGENPTDVSANRATLQQQPRQAVMEEVRMLRHADSLTARRLILEFGPNNNVSRGRAEGEVRLIQGGIELSGPRLDFITNGAGDLQSAVMAGGVQLQGANGQHGHSDKVSLAFSAQGQADSLHATGDVHLAQPGSGPRAQDTELISEALDVQLGPGGVMERANTTGAARILLTQAASQRVTTLTADRFVAAFDPKGQLSSITGAAHAHSLTTTPDQPDATTSSETMTARFGANGLMTVSERGGFRYMQATRNATAELATYSVATELLSLTGAPRIADENATTTAQTIVINQVSSEASAEGDVKSTWLPKGPPPPPGGLFRTGDATHVTAQHMNAARREDSARYTGSARLWQGSSIVEAPTIEFHRDTRTVLASGSGLASVRTSFLQRENGDKITPVNVTSARLTYEDLQRRARFEGGVVLRSAARTMRSRMADVFLTPTNTDSGAPATDRATKVERMEAFGQVHLEEPGRIGDGERLVYTAADQKSVLTGTPETPPSIFDAEQGKVTGDSLTFYNTGDRVLVSSDSNSRAITRTHVNTAPKK